jgi:hypothetical protein
VSHGEKLTAGAVGVLTARVGVQSTTDGALTGTNAPPGLTEASTGYPLRRAALVCNKAGSSGAGSCPRPPVGRTLAVARKLGLLGRTHSQLEVSRDSEYVRQHAGKSKMDSEAKDCGPAPGGIRTIEVARAGRIAGPAADGTGKEDSLSSTRPAGLGGPSDGRRGPGRALGSNRSTGNDALPLTDQ